MSDKIDRKLERGAKKLKQIKLNKITRVEYKKEIAQWLS